MRLHLLCMLALSIVILGACGTTLPPLPNADLDVTVVADFDRVRPVRVVVSPLDMPPDADAPADEIRAAFYGALIERHYAPFRLDLPAASIPRDAALGTLVIRLTSWDRSRLADKRVILASGEASLVRGERVLWKAVYGSLALRTGRSDEPMSLAEKDRRAALALGARVLRELPPKVD